MAEYSRQGLFRRLEGGGAAATNATLTGTIELGEDVSVWFGCVLRGDDATASTFLRLLPHPADVVESLRVVEVKEWPRRLRLVPDEAERAESVALLEESERAALLEEQRRAAAEAYAARQRAAIVHSQRRGAW